MKKRAIILFISFTCLIIDSGSTPMEYNGDTLCWVVAVKACTNANFNIFVDSNPYSGVATCSNCSSNSSADARYFTDSKNTGQYACNNANYVILNTDYDRMPSNATITLSTGFALNTTFGEYIPSGNHLWSETNDGNGNSIQAHLRLWHTNNVIFEKTNGSNNQDCKYDSFRLSNINFFIPNERLLFKIYEGNTLLETIIIFPPEGATFPCATTYENSLSNILPSTSSAIEEYILKCEYYYGTISGIPAHFISDEKNIKNLSVNYTQLQLNLKAVIGSCSYSNYNVILDGPISGLDGRTPNIRYSLFIMSKSDTIAVKTTYRMWNSSNTKIFEDIPQNEYYYNYYTDDYCVDTTYKPLNFENDKTPIVLNSDKINETCFDKKNGSITFQPTGGTPKPTFPDYTTKLTHESSETYTITSSGDNSVATHEFSVLGNSISLSVGATFLNDATSITFELINPYDNIVIGPITSYSHSYKIQNPIAGNWKIRLYAPDFERSWNIYSTEEFAASNDSPYTYRNLQPTNYYATVYDANGCKSIEEITIDTAKKFTIDTSKFTVPICKDHPEWSVKINPINNHGDCKFYLDNVLLDAKENYIKGSGLGEHYIYLEDQDTCASNIYTLNVSSYSNEITINGVDTISNVKCFGEETGEIKITAENADAFNLTGLSPYTTSEITGLKAGKYKLVATNTENCSAEYPDSIEITGPPRITFSAKYTNLKCYNDNSGTIIFSDISGGNGGPYTFYNDKNEVFNSLSEGTYYIGAKDKLDCISEYTTISISQPAELKLFPKATKYNGYDVQCYNYNNGIITLSSTGGTRTSLTYSCSNCTGTRNDSIFSGLAINKPNEEYNFSVKDTNGCVANESIALTENPTGIEITSLTSELRNGYNISCKNGSDGEIKVTYVGGVMDKPYTVVLTGPAPTQTRTVYTKDTTFTALPAGTYIVTVTDANSCEASGTITLYEPPTSVSLLLTFEDHNGYNVRCFGEYSLVKASAKGGIDNSNYSYKWDNNVENDSTALKAGPHSITVSDANNCIVNQDFIIYQPSALKIFNNSLTNIPTCYYSTDGVVACKASGGVLSKAIAKYVLSLGDSKLDSVFNNDSSAVFSNRKGEIYKIKITDNNGCIKDSIFDIINHDTIDVDIINSKIPSCYGGSDGILNIRGIKGKKINNIDYLFSIIQQGKRDSSLMQAPTGHFDTLISTVYSYRVTDNLGCSVTKDIRIGTPHSMKMNSLEVPNICYGDSKATLSVIASGGYDDYKISYSFLDSSKDFTSIPNDTLILTKLNWNKYSTDEQIKYVFRLRDSHFVESQSKCTVSDTFSLTIRPRILQDMLVQSPRCYSYSDGSIELVNVTGGQGNILDWSYSWTKDDSYSTYSGMNLQGLSSGFYNLLIRDSVSCTKYVKAIELKDPAKLALSEPAPTCDSCITGCGTITYVVSGKGTASSISYSIDNKDTLTIYDLLIYRENLSADTFHTLRVRTNPNNCTISDTFKIFHVPPVITLVDTQPAGIGAANGNILVQASKGSGKFKYYWSKDHISLNDITGSNANGLTKGTYYVYAVDSDRVSTDTIKIELGETAQLTIGITKEVNATCPKADNGFAHVNINGSNTPFNFLWQNSLNDTISQDSMLVDVRPGYYKLTVTDNVGSKVTKTVTINHNPPLSITHTAQITSCYGSSDGFLHVFVNGGSGQYSYKWFNNDTNSIIQNLPKGKYYIDVTDKTSSSCYISDTFEINQPEKLRFVSVTKTKPTCYKGSSESSIEVAVKGGIGPYTYTWPTLDKSQNKVSEISAGNYPVKISDINKCYIDSTIVLQDTLPIQLNSVIETMPLCYGDKNGAIVVSFKNGRSPYKTKWTDFGSDVLGSRCSDLFAGTYKINTTDYNGCTLDTFVVLRQPTALKIDSTESVLPTCSNAYNGTIKVYSSGGTSPYKYKWSDLSSSQTATNLKAGSYWVEVADKNLCKKSQNTSLASPAPLVARLEMNQPTCNGLQNGSLRIIPQGGTPGYTFTLNGETAGLENNGLSANKYYIEITDSHLCNRAIDTVLNQPDILLAKDTLLKVIKCAGNCEASVKLNVSGGTFPYSALWNDDITLFERNNLCAGDFIANVSDAKSCQFRLPITITEPDPVVMLDSKTFLPTCAEGCDGKLTASFYGGSAPFKITWSNGSVGDTAFNLCAGNYTVYVRDTNNCGATKVLSLPDQKKEKITGVSKQIKLCENQSLTLNPGLWATYRWFKNGEEVSKEQKYTISEGGKYHLEVVSLKGCSDSLSFTAEYIKDLLHADFLVADDVFANEEVEMIDITWPMPDNIEWKYNTDSITLLSSINDRQLISFKYPGEYLIKMIAQSSSCIDSATQVVNVYLSKDDYDKGKRPVGNYLEISELTLFPNPNNGEFNVNIKLNQPGKAKLEIFKIFDGASLFRKELDGANEYKVPVNIAYQAPGVYSLSVTTANQKKQFLFVVIK